MVAVPQATRKRRPVGTARGGRAGGGPARRRRRSGGFSMIELAAAVTILVLLVALALPILDVGRGRSSREAAERLAARLELGRLRAVATGVPHRVVLDLDGRGYQLEWRVTEARARGEDAPDEGARDAVYEIGEDDRVWMTPPPDAERDYHPLPGTHGDWTPLLDDVFFERVETASGFVDRGRVDVVFERDGTTEAAEIVLEDGDGALAALSVEPFADAIRIRHERS